MAEDGEPRPTWLDLYDWRKRVAEMYREREQALRRGEDELTILNRFRAQKDLLFKHHPQSPLDTEQRESFTSLYYFPHNPALRLEATLEPDESGQAVPAHTGGPHAMPLQRAARLRFTLEGTPQSLSVYWIDVYGGGLFLPFRDATCPTQSYGGGRYLFDTVKGSDFLRTDKDEQAQELGYTGGTIILDFNYAYNPSCAYDAQWICPLAPRENWLNVPVRAGEQKFKD